MRERRDILRHLPKIDEVLTRDPVKALDAPRWAIIEAIRREVAELRRAILDGASERVELDLVAVQRLSAELARPSLRRVINATGVVLHTNLGRAPLAPAAVQAAAEAASGYSNLEYKLDAGARGSRHTHLSDLLRALTGAEAAVAVNNNAAAVMIGLAALASGREVIVSRGELIEIGGSFRIPDVMRLSGARLVEVGTTNKTRLEDYRRAITDETALLLKVHRSNFEMVGFVEETSLSEICGLAKETGIQSMIDLGSGALLDGERLAALGLRDEPGVRDIVQTGVDLVTFSGDKLMGGPQAGLVAGTERSVSKVRTHPLMRAMRPDKLTISALSATLRLYRDGVAEQEIPTLAMLGAAVDELQQRAEELLRRVGKTEKIRLRVVELMSTVGGGAVPLSEIPSRGIALEGISARRADEILRAGEPPVVGRIDNDRLLLDVRTLFAGPDLDAVAAAVRCVEAGA